MAVGPDVHVCGLCTPHKLHLFLLTVKNGREIPRAVHETLQEVGSEREKGKWPEEERGGREEGERQR